MSSLKKTENRTPRRKGFTPALAFFALLAALRATFLQSSHTQISKYVCGYVRIRLRRATATAILMVMTTTKRTERRKQMSANQSSAGENSTFTQTAGLWCMIGALIGIGVGVKEGLAPTEWGATMFVIMQLIALIANALVFVGVIGLARSGAGGEGWLAKIGLGLALFASALFLPLELYIIFNLEVGGMLLGLSALLQGLGLLLAGIAVVQAGHWHGWHRWMPLLCGLYTFLVLIPALALSPEGYNAWALVGWQIPFALLGLALYQQGAALDRAAVGA